VNVHVKSMQSEQREHPVELISYSVQKCVLSLLWFNPGRQLSTTQPLAHFPPAHPQCDREEEGKSKSKQNCGFR